MRDDTLRPECTCGWPKRAVDNEWFPVIFDSKMCEYQLVLYDGDRRKGTAMMHFCPWCGGTLPKSNRGDFFAKPTEEDKNDVCQKMKGVETSEQMIAALGLPSETCDNPVQTQYSYRDRWESLELVVQVRKRLLGYAVHGKFIRSESESAEAE